MSISAEENLGLVKCVQYNIRNSRNFSDNSSCEYKIYYRNCSVNSLVAMCFSMYIRTFKNISYECTTYIGTCIGLLGKMY